MKKLVTAFLFTSALAFSLAAVACSEDKPTDSSMQKGELRSVKIEEGEGFSITSNLSEDNCIPEGSQLTFDVELGAFYTGSPVAYVNDKPVAPSKDGGYSITVGKEDLTVRVEGVRKDISNMAGSGTMDDAFVVTKPIDLLYIAEKVNAGNRSYTTGAYILANDIDCKGEELEIIGNYSTQSAVFSGTFACESNSETGEFIRHTISNFTIESRDSNYVGLFGAVFADMSVTSSGLFYGICLEDFTISAVADDIRGDNKTITCGSLIGYGVGANMYLCDAKNGDVNVTADNNYFSFVGGLVGYQQGFYEPNYDQYYASEISYSSVDVDVNVLGGVALYAGGITGYMTTNYPYGAAAQVHNSYALGSVSGALRSGGIAGGLGQYSVVSNCYATGEITARSYQSFDSPLITSDEYSHSYAGGIVGYAENDTIANDCFFQGSVSAHGVSPAHYTHSHYAIGGGAAAGSTAANAEAYIVKDCLQNVDLTDDTNITKLLGWQEYNWIFLPKELPTINYAQTSGTVTLSMTVTYVAPSKEGEDKSVKVGGDPSKTLKFFDTSISSLNSYSPIGSFMASESLPLYYESDEHYLSYGYFFDKECTQRVPNAYMPMKNVQLYVGFADPTPIVGTYTMLVDNNTTPLTIRFDPSGMAYYTDGSTESSAPYSFDGEKVILDGVRLARYYRGEVVVDENDTTAINDASFDMLRYNVYYFVGTLKEGSVALYDGTYFTKEDPLVCAKNLFVGEYFVKDANGVYYYAFYGDKATVEYVPVNGTTTYTEYASVSVNGNVITLTNATGSVEVDTTTLTAYDKFKGSWVQSATVDKVYTFDGMGNWTYVYTAYERSISGYQYSCDKKTITQTSGTYEVTETGITLYLSGQASPAFTASFNSDGQLVIQGNGTAVSYYRAQSYVGVWQSNGYELQLFGINENELGEAILTDGEGFETKLLYEVGDPVTASLLNTTQILAFYYEGENKSKDSIFGYASYDLRKNILAFTLPDSEAASGYTATAFYLYDDYYGEWITNDSVLGNVNFSFNGMGLYPYLGRTGILTLTENGKETKVEYTLDSTMNGRFAYDGVAYDLSYDDVTKSITVTLGSDTTLQRKDELASIPFLDLEGVRYTFDGKSTLGEGKMTIAGETEPYAYVKTAEGFDIQQNGSSVGSLVKKETHYLLTINGAEKELYIENEFMGDWAISGQYALFEIGPTDLQGKVKAYFKGSSVTMSYLDPKTLTFYYRDGRMPYTYYVYVIYDDVTGENVLVLSEFTNLLAGDYFICSRVSELYGTWSWNQDEGKTTLKFDGVNSSYANGSAEYTLHLNYSTVSTSYFYMLRNGGIIMWSSELLADRTWYYRLELVTENVTEAAKEKDAFVMKDENGNVIKVLRRAPVDGMYLMKAYDEDGVEYNFSYENGKNVIVVGSGADAETRYTYVTKSYNGDNTATIHATTMDGSKTYIVTVDYTDSTHLLFILGDEYVEEKDETVGIHNHQ